MIHKAHKKKLKLHCKNKKINKERKLYKIKHRDNYKLLYSITIMNMYMTGQTISI